MSSLENFLADVEADGVLTPIGWGWSGMPSSIFWYALGCERGFPESEKPADLPTIEDVDHSLREEVILERKGDLDTIKGMLGTQRTMNMKRISTLILRMSEQIL